VSHRPLADSTELNARRPENPFHPTGSAEGRCATQDEERLLKQALRVKQFSLPRCCESTESYWPCARRLDAGDQHPCAASVGILSHLTNGLSDEVEIVLRVWADLLQNDPKHLLARSGMMFYICSKRSAEGERGVPGSVEAIALAAARDRGVEARRFGLRLWPGHSPTTCAAAPVRALTAAKQGRFSIRIACNPLIRRESDEEIQENPSPFSWSRLVWLCFGLGNLGPSEVT